MTLFSAIQSVRVWGLRGVLNYLHRWPVLHRLAKSDKQKYATPERGLTLIGPFSVPSGISQTMRHLATLLRAAGIPHQTFDTCDRHSLPKSDYTHLLTPTSEFDLSRYDHVIELFSAHAPKAPNRVHALLMFWEFSTGFDYAIPEAKSGAPLIAMSDFNVSTLSASTDGKFPVFKILFPLILNNTNIPSRETIRARYGIQPNAVAAFFNFDYGSSYYRKNPESVARAFAKAFPTGTENVVLVLKTPPPREPYAKILKRTISELALENRTILIERSVPQPDMSGLINACDIYISLHRGEGFGIGMAEAMSLGKPVIATNYSANTEFCRPDCSIPIPYKMVPVPLEQKDIVAYAKVQEWADADIDAAAKALRKLYDDPMLREKIGMNARAFINSYFNLENFKSSVERFLDSKPSK